MSPKDIFNNVVVNIFGKESSSIHHNHYTVSQLHLAVISGDLEAVKKVIKHDNINSVDQYHTTPLFYAVICQKEDVIKYLLDLGADTKKITGFGISAEQLAENTGIDLF